MSNSAVPLRVMAVYEPRLELNNERSWIVVKGAQTTTYYPFPATSYSNNQFNFICNPPSANTVLDRSVFIEVPFTITFVSNALNLPVGNLLVPGSDAFRAFPLSSVTNTLSCTINGYVVNLELSQVIHCLSRFHSPLALKNGWMSGQPAMEDNYASYIDAAGANNNPLGQFGDSTGMSELGRGAYPYGTGAQIKEVINNNAGATIQGILREQIFLPPFLWDECQAGGLSNLTSLTFNFILNNNLGRMWSHNPVTDILTGAPPNQLVQSTIGSINVNFAQPSLYLGFLTPRLSQPIPPRITYPFFNISRFTTQFGDRVLLPNASDTFKSNIIQLDSIPRKIYCYCKPSDSVIYGSSLSALVSTPDVFLQINNLNVTWNNNQGVLSGASPMNLYQFTRSNGYSKTWTEFNGYTQRITGVLGQPTKCIGLEGGIVCLELGKDVGLHDNEAEGVIGNFNLQIQMQVTNQNQYQNIKPDMYIVCVFDGTLVISNTSAMASIGVASREDVLMAPVAHNISYNELEKIYGGDFFSKFKGFLGDVNSFLRKYKPISTIASAFQHPSSQAVARAAEAVGYGVRAGAQHGGVLFGGRRADRADLRRRLRM